MWCMELLTPALYFHRTTISMTCTAMRGGGQVQGQHQGLQYKDAGVDITAGDLLVEYIKPLAKMTRQGGCNAELGGFGGLFDLTRMSESTTLSCVTGGVGPKIKVNIKK